MTYTEQKIIDHRAQKILDAKTPSPEILIMAPMIIENVAHFTKAQPAYHLPEQTYQNCYY
jgi:hypothetical protein